MPMARRDDAFDLDATLRDELIELLRISEEARAAELPAPTLAVRLFGGRCVTGRLLKLQERGAQSEVALELTGPRASALRQVVALLALPRIEEVRVVDAEADTIPLGRRRGTTRLQRVPFARGA